MVATTSPHDELPTSRYAVLPRRGPPPLPSPPMPLRVLRPSRVDLPIAPRLTAVRLPAVMPPVLGRGKLIIELPIDQLEEQEMAQITSWLRGRATSITVRQKMGWRIANAAVSYAMTAHTHVRTGLRAAVVWTLARVTTKPAKALH